jgi:zinc protease
MKKPMLAIAIAALCAGAAQAAQAAQATDVDKPAVPTAVAMPAYGKDRALPAPHIVKKTLANGLQVWVLPRDGVPRVDMVLAVRGAGLAADDAAHPGFATLLAGLLNEGTGRHDSRAIAELAQGLGGSVAAGASTDGITVQASALPSQAAPMMALLAEVTRTPSFPAREVALAKANALQGLRVAEAQPQYRAERALIHAVYGDHPYGRTMPTAAAIESTSAALLHDEHAKRFRPERALLVITGRITEADALKLADGAFGDWKAGGPAAPDAPKAPAAVKPVRLLLDRAGSVQSTIRLGSPGIAATAADQVPLRLAGDILGGGFSNRVNLNLREEKGYTYGAGAGPRLLREGGSIVGSADVRNDVTGAALTEFLAEYKRIGADLVGPDEMRMHKRYLAGSYLLSNQMQRAVAATLARNWLVGLPAEFLGQYVPLIEKVTPEQVREVSRKYFAPQNQSVVVVGDARAVDAQLKAFGDFTVVDQ